MDPLTAAGIFWAISTAINFFGQWKAGSAAKKAGVEANKMELYNAQVEEDAAADALQRGVFDEQQLRSGLRGMIGTQRAGFASQGVDVGQGSAADVQADVAYLGELDALTLRNNAAREAHGFKVEAERARQRGKYALLTGQQAQTAARIGAVGTIAGNAASALQMKYGMGAGSRAPRTPSTQPAAWAIAG